MNILLTIDGLRSCRRIVAIAGIGLMGSLVANSFSRADNEGAPQTPAKAAVSEQATGNTATGKKKPEKLPEPRDVTLPAKDGVQVHARYWASLQGKTAVPILVLHGWQGRTGAGSTADLEAFNRRLQQAGHAVIAPDFRGHGQTRNRILPNGDTETVTREGIPLSNTKSFAWDIEAARSFLLQENNAGRLNIELLTVIGFDFGGLVGMHWIHDDWSIPSLPTYKQGQDVKAFVLVSPPSSQRGLNIQGALAHDVVRSDLSAMIIVGRQQANAFADAKRIHQTLKRSHRPVRSGSESEFQDLFFLEMETALQGTRVLETKQREVEDAVLEFIRRRIVARQTQFPWQDRKRPE